MTKKNLITKFQLDFEMNPSYEGRRTVLRQMREAGLHEEADDLRMQVCDMCLGTGEVDDLVFNDDSKSYMVEGTRKCLCKMIDEHNDQD